MSKRQTLEQEINEFLEKWDCEKHTSFISDIIPILELYDVDEHNDWVMDEVGKDDVRNVRLIRTVYLISRLAYNHSGTFAIINFRFKDLWKRMEKNVG